MAVLLQQVSVPAIVLLVVMILVIAGLNFILPGVVPKWAIFAPVFTGAMPASGPSPP